MPESRKTALLVIDMLNRYDHEDAEPLLESARAAVPAIARLLTRGWPTSTPTSRRRR
jgi:nicotinamidase-related amidase